MSDLDVLLDLRDRLSPKVNALNEMATKEGLRERDRLRGKAAGVALAISLIDDAIRAAGSPS